MKHTIILAITAWSLALVMSGCFEKQKPAANVHFELPIGGVVAVCAEAEEYAGGVVNLNKCMLMQGGIPVGSVDSIKHAANFLMIEDKPENK